MSEDDAVTFSGYDFSTVVDKDVELAVVRCLQCPDGSWRFTPSVAGLQEIAQTIQTHNQRCPGRLPPRIFAPFTPEQVEGLNRFQTEAPMHPFTCRNRGDHESEGVLTATVEGWVCGECDYTQNWAHRFMAEWDEWPGAESRQGH